MTPLPLTKAECSACLLLVTKELAATRALLDTAVGYHLSEHIQAFQSHVTKSEALVRKLTALRDAAST